MILSTRAQKEYRETRAEGRPSRNKDYKASEGNELIKKKKEMPRDVG